MASPDIPAFIRIVRGPEILMTPPLPYCGAAALPETLLERFNLDPILVAVLAVALALSLRRAASRRAVVWGWAVAAFALLSPLCALSVSLFSARIAQHMVLLLAAAPLLALGLPAPRNSDGRIRVWLLGGAFLVALWYWHMPNPYQATFDSKFVYWVMHLTLFGTGVLLWRELLAGRREAGGDALAVALLTSMQMGLLGAVLTVAGRPLFFAHLTTTQVWGLTPLEDQQLGGVIMWVPGIALFLWASLRGLARLRSRFDDARRV
jgi:putative membrane protein